LLQIVHAANAPHLGLANLERRREQTRKQRDDPNHNQQFDQTESAKTIHWETRVSVLQERTEVTEHGRSKVHALSVPSVASC
jgi:hypothetical protein